MKLRLMKALGADQCTQIVMTQHIIVMMTQWACVSKWKHQPMHCVSQLDFANKGCAPILFWAMFPQLELANEAMSQCCFRLCFLSWTSLVKAVSQYCF